MKNILTIILFISPLFVLAQSKEGASQAGADSSVKGIEQPFEELDSVRSEVRQQLDSLKGSIYLLQARLDSMQQTGSTVHHLRDSLQLQLQKGLALQQELGEKYNGIAAPLEQVPAFSLPQLQGGVDVGPAANLKFNILSPLAKGPSPSAELIKSPFTIGRAEDPLATFPLGDFPTIDSTVFSGHNIDATIEQQLLKQKEVAALQKHADMVEDPMTDFLDLDAKELTLKQGSELQAQKMLPPAVDHFAGQKVELDKARQQLNRYKGRFTEVKSLKELPKSPLKRHPLMGVVWHRRLQPGLQWQLGSSAAFHIDMGPRLGYLLTDQVELGAAIQSRISIGKAVPQYMSTSFDRVWGYQLFGNYRYKKGFYGQVSYERLHVQLQQLPHQQERPDERDWVDGMRLGLGKRYTLYKKVQGYSLLEYNFARSIHAPYRQQLQVKVGMLWDRRSNRK